MYFCGNEMMLTPRQRLKFAELYLHRGRSDDRKIIPSLWVESSWVPRTRSLRSGQLYGYCWWITELAGRPIEFAWGFGGQYIFVVPSLDLVVVTTSSVALGEDRREYRVTLFDMVKKDVI